MELGYIVSKPTLDASKYDAIIDNGERLIKVQIKSRMPISGRSKNATPAISLIGSKKYIHSDFDYYALYMIDSDEWFVIPFGDCVSFTLSEANKKKYSTFAFR